jgi:hypothetical protein
MWVILEPGGMVTLALPHRDHTFDSKRKTTSFAELLDSYIAQLSRPSPRQIADHMFGVHCHFENDLFANSGSLLREVVSTVRQSVAESVYTDCHCSVFTPTSFATTWSMLDACGLTCFDIIGIEDGTEGAESEFYVYLCRRPIAGVALQP